MPRASGCGAHQVSRQLSTIKICMFVKLPDLQVKIFEQVPEGGEPDSAGVTAIAETIAPLAIANL